MTDSLPPPEENSQISLFNRRATFGDTPADELGRDENIPCFSQRFVVHFDGNRSQPVRLHTHPLPILASEAAGLIWSECQHGGQINSPGAVEDFVQTLRRFGDFVFDAGLNEKAKRLSDITIAVFNAFDAYLQKRYGVNHYITYTRMASMRRFLEIANEHGLVSKELLPRLSYGTKTGRGSIDQSPKPRDAYSPYIAEQIRQACLKDIEATVERITIEGGRLLAGARDPTEHGWNCAENILWAMANRGLANISDPTAPSENYIQNYLWDRCEYGFSDLIRFIHMDSDDVFPFVVLLSLESGLPIESVMELTADCLKNEARGYVDIVYTKRRGNRTSDKIKRVKLADRNSPGALIKLILRLTRRTREHALESDKNWLFVGYLGRAVDGSRLRRIKILNSANVNFCIRHKILDDLVQRLRRITLARLRKTHKSEHYLRENGHLADAADDHTVRVHAGRYANIPSLSPLHEQTIAAGLQQALEAAFTPIVITADAERHLQSNPATIASKVGLTTDQAEAVVSGSNDVWLASCLDHEHSPHNHGDTCQTPVWGCLECRNAVITSSKLPATLAFLNHILDRRQQMNLTAWAVRYGRAHDRITKQILPRFPAKEVAVAKAIAEAETDLLWLPAELTMTR